MATSMTQAENHVGALTPSAATPFQQGVRDNQQHRSSVRPGRGWKESRCTGKPVESNFVVDCSCGFTMPCCTLDVAYAERRAVEHERTGR